MAEKIVIVGCGYVGSRWVRSMREAPLAFSGSDEGAARAAQAGARALVWDLDRDEAPPAPLPEGALVAHLAPPPKEGDDDPRFAKLLARLTEVPPRRLVYVSTSGVYGDCQGAWVDESWPRAPRSARAIRRAAAEERAEEFAATSGSELAILRVPGIYGPGRLPLARLEARRPILDPAIAPPSNRIHADDLARALDAALAPGAPTGPFNVGDGHPTSMSDYFLRLAEVFGLPKPPLVGWEEAERALGPAMLSFLEESKRLDVRRMREELGVEPLYPELGVGLAQIRAESAHN